MKKATDRGCQVPTVKSYVPIPHFYDSRSSWKRGCKVHRTATRPCGLISPAIRKTPEWVGKGYEMSKGLLGRSSRKQMEQEMWERYSQWSTHGVYNSLGGRSVGLCTDLVSNQLSLIKLIKGGKKGDVPVLSTGKTSSVLRFYCALKTSNLKKRRQEMAPQRGVRWAWWLIRVTVSYKWSSSGSPGRLYCPEPKPVFMGLREQHAKLGNWRKLSKWVRYTPSKEKRVSIEKRFQEKYAA